MEEPEALGKMWAGHKEEPNMEYIKQSINFTVKEPTVLSLGKFDGLHRGHELLMEYMAEKKREKKISGQ